MQPEQPQYSVDYLDSIATKPPAKTLNPFVLWGLIIGVLVIVVVVVVMVASAGGSSTDKLRSFGARLADLKTVSADAQDSVKSADMRTLNSNLSLVVTNANRDLQGPLTDASIKLDDKKNKQIVEVAGETEELKTRLEDARLNAIFDRTYAREMTYYIKSLRSEMGILYESTRSKSLKSMLITTDDNLDPLQKSFSSFNAS